MTNAILLKANGGTNSSAMRGFMDGDMVTVDPSTVGALNVTIYEFIGYRYKLKHPNDIKLISFKHYTKLL